LPWQLQEHADSLAVLFFNRRWHYVKEPRLSVSPNLFMYNPDINPSMRCKLVNWLIEVGPSGGLRRAYGAGPGFAPL
jgi:hypothetical protein